MDFADQLILMGIPGLFIAAFLAGTVVPFSSEIILLALLPFEISPMALLVSASLGNWLGGMTTFGLGRLGKTVWLEKYFGISHQKMTRYESRIHKSGSVLAVLSWIPIAGNMITAGLGFFKTPVLPVALWMFAGKAARYVSLILIYTYWDSF